MNKKVALVIGASSGFGKGVAESLCAKGFQVYAGARRLTPMEELKEKGISIFSIDVTDEQSVHEGIGSILAKEGRIDVLINNAGFGAYGPIESVPLADVIGQFDVNLFGLARVNNAVLPLMRKQGYGRIIMTASLSSYVSTPLTGWYAASKHALKAMAEALRMELKHIGIDVVQIEPGPVHTGFEEVAFKAMENNQSIETYKDITSGFYGYMTKTYKNAPSIKSTINNMVKAATVKHPKPIYRTTLESKVLPIVRSFLGIKIFTVIILGLFKKEAKK